MSTRILALDTATEACSAAVAVDGEVVAQQFELAPRRHAELILPQLDAVLSKAGLSLHQLDALAYGRGPGAFTGVRLAASVVQGVAFAAGLPVVPVSDLAALAYGTQCEFGASHNATHWACAIDARMDEIYWACYCADSGSGVRLIGEEIVAKPHTVVWPFTVSATGALPEGTVWHGVGSGWARYAPVLQGRIAVQQVWPDRYPTATAVALLGSLLWHHGAAVPAQDALPVYLRDRVVQRSQPSVGPT